MAAKKIKIEGMSCAHCVASLKKELEKIPNLKIESIAIGDVVVDYDEKSVSDKMINDAIEEAGYKIS
jgi:copper chaperone